MYIRIVDSSSCHERAGGIKIAIFLRTVYSVTHLIYLYDVKINLIAIIIA